MNKKLLALALVTLMILGLLPALVPIANAAEQVPRHEPTCELDDVAAGEWDVTSFDSPICMFLHPGVEDAYKPGWSHTLGTLWGLNSGDETPGTPGTNGQTRQVFDKYLEYAILASASDSVGDFQFDITVLNELNWIAIYVPPDFTFLGPSIEESIWTDITNDYAFIWSQTMSSYDPIAPGWTRIMIGAEEWSGATFNIVPDLYHVRLFNLRAPDVAGLYHFKIYTNDPTADWYYVGHSIGAVNFPFVIVKTELNPAWVEVTVRAHLNIDTLISGKVLAEGTTPEGRAVKGVAYWGPMDEIGFSDTPGELGNLYRTYLFGLAAGTYTITAEGSGYNPTITERITLNPGQSYSVFIVILASPDVCVTIWSKHGTGAIPWHNLWQLPYGTNNPTVAPSDDEGPWRDILIDLYDSEGNLIGFWGSNVFGSASEWTMDVVPNPNGVWNDAAPKWFAGSNMLLGLHDDLAPHPESTSFYACLYDNWDPTGTDRFYSSTHWDGHVPWDFADYIAGYPNGQYSVEAFVTGYIMDEADAYQRSFTIAGTAYNLQLDLRRSNWIDIVMHPAGVWPVGGELGDTTVTLVGTDVGDHERGALSFQVTVDVNGNGAIDGNEGTTYYNVNSGGLAVDLYDGGLVLEGWNTIFPNMGSSLGRGTGGARDISRKDYGLNPIASTHSAGQVELSGNPYTISLYMADMGIPYADVLGTGWYNILGGDPMVSVFLCNSPTPISFKIVNAWLWISLRSVDFEVPAHSRPWTFPGSEIWVHFKDVATGDVVDTLDPTLFALFQDPGTTEAGFPIVGAPAGSFGVTPFDIDNVNDPGYHEHLGVRYTGLDWCSATLGGAAPPHRCLLPALRSTRLPAGEYEFDAYTHGYIMRRHFPVQVPFAGKADIEADLIQGGQIRVTMNFKHEAVATNFVGFVRVEVFNDQDELVGASVYGQASPNQFTEIGLGGGYLPWNAITEHLLVEGPALATGYQEDAIYPSSHTVPPDDVQRAFFSQYFYGVPDHLWAGWDSGPAWMASDPADANRAMVAAGDAISYDVYGFYWYCGGPARTWAGGWPTVNTFPGVNPYTGIQSDMGLKGTVDIPGWAGSGGGLYSVKVWAFDSRGPNFVFDDTGFSDDWRMYSMGWPLTNVEVQWGGGVELFVTMNNMATLRGAIRWIDMFGNLRGLPWAQISASPGPSTDSIPAYSSGLGSVGPGLSDPSGAFIMWLPAGAHDVSVSTSEAPGIWGSSAPTSNAEYTVVVSDGWVAGGDTQLSGSGTPIPEVPAYAVPMAIFAALAASVWLLRKKNLNIPLVMK